MEKMCIRDRYRAVSKLTKPIADATHDISEIAFYVLEAETGAGVVGQGYLLSFHYSPNAIEGALKDLKKFVEERDYEICQTQDIQMDYEAESEYFGIVGLQRWALATLNVALWEDVYKRQTWKNAFEKAGYEVICRLKGLGEMEAIQKIFVEHAQAAMDSLAE